MRNVAAGRVLDRLSDELAELTARVLRATVAISGPTAEGGSSGSGFFIDTRGHIVTNHHVVAGMEPPVSVTMQGGPTALAGIVGVDLISDLAVLRLDGRWKHTLPLRHSVARAGELCLAAGNPLGRYPETVTIGVVSGLARTAVAGPGRPHYHLLQTDCGIHEGNSGGPLVDVRGRVIGVTTLIDAESDDIGLAIPVETVKDVVPDLLKHGCVIRATIGVSIRGRTREVDGEATRGLEVVRLRRLRGQALKIGDFILRVDGMPMPDPPALFGVLNGKCIGRPTVVDLVRQGRLRAVTVKPWRLQL